MKTFFIKPKRNLVIRDPHTAVPLSKDGELKPQSTFWLRRLADDDIEETDPPKAESVPAGKPDSDDSESSNSRNRNSRKA